MKKALVATAVIIFLVGGIWIGINGSREFRSTAAASSLTQADDSELDNVAEASGRVRTKGSNRESAGPRATHAPERLKEFMLPEVVIDGLTLGEALRKLTGVYDEACKKTGETPLRLTLEIPPGSTKKLRLKLSPRTFNSSVQLLATFAGMKVSRSKLQYRFEPFADERKQVSRTLQVPPDFNSSLAGLNMEVDASVETEPPQMPISEVIKASGLNLDPSTQVYLTDSGTLDINSTSSADVAMISALVGTLVNEKPVLQKFTQKVVEISSGVDWTPPDVSEMTDGQVQLLMREMAQKAGTDLLTIPSTVARNGQSATIEIVRELITPTGESEQEFETHQLGHVLQVKGDALGFGHEIALSYTNTTGEADTTTGKANINKRTDITNSSFTADGGTRLVVQTRPDGSRTLLFVTSTTIDATGQPVRDKE